MWWCIPVISALGRLRQEKREFKAHLGYIVRVCIPSSPSRTPMKKM
jgi:hypothetical protein